MFGVRIFILPFVRGFVRVETFASNLTIFVFLPVFIQ